MANVVDRNATSGPVTHVLCRLAQRPQGLSPADLKLMLCVSGPLPTGTQLPNEVPNRFSRITEHREAWTSDGQHTYAHGLDCRPMGPVLVTTNTVFLPFQVCWEEDCEQQVSSSGICPNVWEVFSTTAGL